MMMRLTIEFMTLKSGMKLKKENIYMLRSRIHNRYVANSPCLSKQMLFFPAGAVLLWTSRPNVHCKVSSLATEADRLRWSIKDLRPFVEHIVECFGFDRIMFAGDWPVSTQAASFKVCVETLEQLVAGCSESELKKLFRDNADRFYRI
jgi:predicted TIM-barrel fold metal-dependent hydrolase